MSDLQVAALRKKAKRYIVADPELRAHYVRIPPVGPNVFACVARNPDGKQVWHTIGASDTMKIDEARDEARVAIKRIKAGLPAVEPPPAKPDSFKVVADNWLKRYAAPKRLRTLDEIERILKVYVYPRWGERSFEDIKRSDVTALLDVVEDNHGPRQADAVLSVVRQIAYWHSTRSDGYVPPFVPGMRRSSKAPRSRTLDDDEIRAVWKATESGTFGGIVRTLLLTGQRLDKVRCMKWDDIDDDGVWHVPSAPREKNNGGDLKLPKLALDIIRAQPRQASNPYVFTGRGYGAPFSNQAQAKPALDAALPSMPHWQLHDLRRTARSLMSRAGVPSEHAERVLGHAIPGIEGVYDRHSYFDEKATALQELANLVERLVIKGPQAKVASLAVERSKRRRRDRA
jgi:integrase